MPILPVVTRSISESSNAPNPGVIVGSIIGGIALALILAATVFVLVRRYRRTHPSATANQASQGSVERPHYMKHRPTLSDVAGAVPLLGSPLTAQTYDTPESRRHSRQLSYLTLRRDDTMSDDGMGALQTHAIMNPSSEPPMWTPTSTTQKALPPLVIPDTRVHVKTPVATPIDHAPVSSVTSHLKDEDEDSPESQYSQPSASTAHSPVHLRYQIPPEEPPLERADTRILSRLLKARAAGRRTTASGEISRASSQISRIERSDSIKSYTDTEEGYTVEDSDLTPTQSRPPRPLPSRPTITKSKQRSKRTILPPSMESVSETSPTNYVGASVPYSRVPLPSNTSQAQSTLRSPNPSLLTSAFRQSTVSSRQSLTSSDSRSSLSHTPASLSYPYSLELTTSNAPISTPAPTILVPTTAPLRKLKDTTRTPTTARSMTIRDVNHLNMPVPQYVNHRPSTHGMIEVAAMSSS